MNTNKMQSLVFLKTGFTYLTYNDYKNSDMIEIKEESASVKATATHSTAPLNYHHPFTHVTVTYMRYI